MSRWRSAFFFFSGSEVLGKSSASWGKGVRGQSERAEPVLQRRRSADESASGAAGDVLPRCALSRSSGRRKEACPWSSAGGAGTGRGGSRRGAPPADTRRHRAARRGRDGQAAAGAPRSRPCNARILQAEGAAHGDAEVDQDVLLRAVGADGSPGDEALVVGEPELLRNVEPAGDLALRVRARGVAGA